MLKIKKQTRLLYIGVHVLITMHKLKFKLGQGSLRFDWSGKNNVMSADLQKTFYWIFLGYKFVVVGLKFLIYCFNNCIKCQLEYSSPTLAQSTVT